MTPRLLKSWALTAGARLEEAGRLSPGEIGDLYVYRRRYDDEQHQITRAKEGKCYD